MNNSAQKKFRAYNFLCQAEIQIFSIISTILVICSVRWTNVSGTCTLKEERLSVWVGMESMVSRPPGRARTGPGWTELLAAWWQGAGEWRSERRQTPPGPSAGNQGPVSHPSIQNLPTAARARGLAVASPEAEQAG